MLWHKEGDEGTSRLVNGNGRLMKGEGDERRMRSVERRMSRRKEYCPLTPFLNSFLPLCLSVSAKGHLWTMGRGQMCDAQTLNSIRYSLTL